MAEAPLIAGVDEAGRGPLAGPVMAAAVILHPDHPIPGLADSKTCRPGAANNSPQASATTPWPGRWPAWTPAISTG